MKHIQNKTLAVALLILAAAAFSAPVMAQTTEAARIILVDFSRVTQESLVGKDVNAQFDSERVKIQARATELRVQFTAEQQQLQTQEKLVAPDVLQAKVTDLQIRAQAGQAEIDQMQQSLQLAEQQAVLEIQRKLKPIVIAIMNSRGATIVMEKAALYHNVAGLDVTTEVIEGLDAEMPGFQVSLPSNQ